MLFIETSNPNFFPVFANSAFRFISLTLSAEVKHHPEFISPTRAIGLQNTSLPGFLTGQYEPGVKAVDKGSRFDSETGQGKLRKFATLGLHRLAVDISSNSSLLTTGRKDRQRYWNDAYFRALELIGPAANKFNLTLTEVRS